jgi:hypothetical protein
MDNIEYRRGLATWELIVEVHQLLATERRTERLVCRYLADLADRVQQRQDLALARYEDELHAARSCFGLGAREARDRIRVGRALRQLPQVERAFVEGELSYSRVREVTRIATAPDESEWLELARRLDMRALERRVASAQAPVFDDEAPNFQAKPATRPKTRRVTFELSEQAYELVQQALANARSVSGACSDAEALEWLVQEALSAHARATEGGGAPSITPKPIPRWSWDELGWGTTQRESWDDDDDDESQSVDARGDGTTQRASWDDDEEGRGAEVVSGRATQRGSCESDEGRGAGAPGGGTTQRGSWEGDERKRDDARDVDQSEVRQREHDRWSEINTRLLQVMGGRGRWIPDTLIEASGLSASEVNSALTLLQLSGRIRRRADAFEPV